MTILTSIIAAWYAFLMDIPVMNCYSITVTRVTGLYAWAAVMGMVCFGFLDVKSILII